MKKRSFFLSKKFIIYAVIGLLVVAGIVVKVRGSSKLQAVAVTRADVVQEVASTGKVKPNQEVQLGFDKSGRVASVRVGVGDKVKAGQVLASLESGEVSASLAKARASLEEAQIKLREIQNADPRSLSDASTNLRAAIRDGFTTADNAVRNRTDQFFNSVPANPQFEIKIVSGNFIHYFNVPDSLVLEINGDRKKVETILNNWQKQAADSSSPDLNALADSAIRDLNQISSFLDEVAGAVNTFSSSEYAYETTVSGYKTAISTARSEVSGAVSAIVAAKDKLNAAPQVGEGGQLQSVLAQEARVKQAEADVYSLESTLAKSSIIAPFDGVITVQDAKAGSAVNGGAPLISMINQDQMYIEADISEIHIGKINAGAPVTLTFDAFPDEQFSGTVSYVEPGDFLIDGVVNYKVRVNLNNSDPRIKSGLTANLKIQTAKKENVTVIPLYAVTWEGGQSFVKKMSGKEVVKTPVTLGLSGSNGMAEVQSGLSEGDIVEY